MLFLERVVLPLIVAGLGFLLLQSRLDWQSKTSLGFACVCLAYFVAHRIEVGRSDTVQISSSVQPTEAPSRDAGETPHGSADHPVPNPLGEKTSQHKEVPRISSSAVPTPSPSTSVQSAPNSIAIGGDNLGTATVNNYEKPVPPARTITVAAGVAALKILKQAPVGSKLFITVVGGGKEPYDLSLVVRDIFLHAGWLVEGQTTGELHAVHVGADGRQNVFRGEGVTCMSYNSNDPAAILAIQAMNVLDIGNKLNHFDDEDWPGPRPYNITVVFGTRILPPLE